MNIICPICNKEFSDNKHPYREHKIVLADFFIQYFPRKDKLTNESIPFKNTEQYLTTDFINKRNFSSWVKKYPNEAPAYCKSLLSKRKEKKGLVYSMSQVELKTLPIPSIPTYEALFGDYYKLCSELGFVNKYRKEANLSFNPVNYTVQADTREQKELVFKDKITTHLKLDFGDYLLKSKDNYVYFERKGLSDLIGTLSTGYDRFKKELLRAKEANEHLIIICEEKLSNLLSFNYLPHISRKIRVTPEFIVHNVRGLIQEFPNIQFVFCEGRAHTKEVMEKILWMGPIYKELDLELLVETKII